MSHICIIGAGLGGIPMALDMKAALGNSDSVTVISDKENYEFVPSNPWVAVGWRSPEEIKIPLPSMFQKKNIHFTSAGVQYLEPGKNCIHLTSKETIHYDFLVIATGAKTNFSKIPGFGPHIGFTHSICHTSEAEKTYQAWQEFLENPGPIVAGASQGVSCFGPAYEFTMIMDTELRRRKIRDKCPITFITPEPYIGHMGLGGVGNTKESLSQILEKRDIHWITNVEIENIEKEAVHISEYDSLNDQKRRHSLPYRFSMIMPSFLGVEAIRNIDGLVDQKGFVLTNSKQQNPVFKNIFAIGVAVSIPPVEKGPIPIGVPKTGFMIESMVASTVKNINNIIKGKDAEFEPTLNAICLADFGDEGLGFLAIPQIPPRQVDWSSSGKHIHLAKLAFEKYFLHKIREGKSTPFYEHMILKMLGISKIRNYY